MQPNASFTPEGVTGVMDFQNGFKFGIAFTMGGVMAGVTGGFGTFCSTGRFLPVRRKSTKVRLPPQKLSSVVAEWR